MGKKTKSVNNKQSTGIDFIRAKKKVGRKIRKQANETNTEVRAKRINLSVQSLGTEGKGDQVTGRGLSMPELLNQCQHYNAQAKVGFQLRVCAEKGEPFDPDHTVYNKDYLLEILDRGKAALDEMKAAGQL